jgi:hypothetical protein
MHGCLGGSVLLVGTLTFTNRDVDGFAKRLIEFPVCTVFVLRFDISFALHRGSPGKSPQTSFSSICSLTTPNQAALRINVASVRSITQALNAAIDAMA